MQCFNNEIVLVLRVSNYHTTSFTVRRLEDHGAARIVAVCALDLLSTRKKKTKKKTLSVNVRHCSSGRRMFAAEGDRRDIAGPSPTMEIHCVLSLRCVIFPPPPLPPKKFHEKSLTRSEVISLSIVCLKTPVRWSEYVASQLLNFDPRPISRLGTP